MGRPRAVLARHSRAQRRGVRQWMAAIALSADWLVADNESRAELVEDVVRYLRIAKSGRRTKEATRASLRQVLEEVPGRTGAAQADLAANVATIAGFLRLSAVESELLAFLTTLTVNDHLVAAAGSIEARVDHHFNAALARVLGCTAGEVRRALEMRAPLVVNKLIDYQSGYWNFGDRLQVNAAVASRLVGRRAPIEELLKAFFGRAPAPTLKIADFAHLAESVALMLRYIGNARRKGEVGVNVLLYGLPGTGKTELARLAARELGWSAVEVNTEREDGEPARPKDRIASYRMAQKFLADKRDALVIFDELEDAFGGSDDFSDTVSPLRPFGKLWMNKLLESNEVPTIWIANQVDRVDTAHLRRFDLVIRFDTLPRAVRMRMVEKHLGGFALSGRQTLELHSRVDMLPSQVAMAAKVARSAARRGREGETLMRVLDASMELLGQAPTEREQGGIVFDTKLVNASEDIEQTVDALREGAGSGRILLSGAPGTGKSAFARYVAMVLGRDVRVLSPSMLLSPFAGETARRIAGAFAEAGAKGTVLVWEEAEGVLGARGEASAGWELSVTNDMLLQMERFEGLAFFTTNVPSMLDAAAMRRFDLRITFHDLRWEQRLRLWRLVTGADFAGKDRQRVERFRKLERLTTGDFVTVGRRAKCIGARWGPEEWLAALEVEHGLKRDAGTAIGFVVSGQ